MAGHGLGQEGDRMSDTWSPRQFTTPTLALMVVAIAVNVAIGYLVQQVLRLPIYLDSIGTVLVGVLAGPLAGLATGVIANVLWGVTIGPATIIPYAIVAGAIGLIAGVVGSRGWLSSRRSPASLGLAVLAGLITGIVGALLSAPITVMLGGVTGGGTDVLIALFRNVTGSLYEAALFQSGVSDPVDKIITYAVAWAVLLAVPVATKTLFPQGEKAI